jgi:isopenicillin N synthase-like dioxygenase
VRSPTTGEWLEVPAQSEEGPQGEEEEEALLSVHVGRGLQIMTGGRLLATRHRVLHRGAARESVGFFYCPHPGRRLPLEVVRRPLRPFRRPL